MRGFDGRAARLSLLRTALGLLTASLVGVACQNQTAQPTQPTYVVQGHNADAFSPDGERTPAFDLEAGAYTVKWSIARASACSAYVDLHDPRSEKRFLIYADIGDSNVTHGSLKLRPGSANFPPKGSYYLTAKITPACGEGDWSFTFTPDSNAGPMVVVNASSAQPIYVMWGRLDDATSTDGVRTPAFDLEADTYVARIAIERTRYCAAVFELYNVQSQKAVPIYIDFAASEVTQAAVNLSFGPGQSPKGQYYLKVRVTEPCGEGDWFLSITPVMDTGSTIVVHPTTPLPSPGPTAAPPASSSR